MKSSALNPHIRYIDKVSIQRPYPQPVLAYDFRMFYIVKGGFELELEKSRLKVFEGDLVTIPPATAYRILYYDNTETEYYILNFDFVSGSERYTPRPPDSAEEFSRELVFSEEFYGPFGKVLRLQNVYIAEELLDECFRIDREQSDNSRNSQSALLKYLIARAAADYEKGENDSKNAKLSEKIKRYIEENYSKELTNQSVAAYFGYHPHYLNSVFMKTEKMTLHKYIDKVRLKYAREMLNSSNKLIGEIALECGFEDPSYFCKFFCRNMGITPKEYRRLAK